MRESPQSPRMFETEWIDRLSRTPWWTVPLVWLPISLFLLVSGLQHDAVRLPAAAVTFAGGWLVWSFAEYVLHRTLFHWKPKTSWGPRMHFLLHGVHHDWVFDQYRLVMPPAASILIGTAFGLMFRALLGPTWFLTTFAGFTFGYMVYDVVHYATHHLKLSNRWFLALKKHHLLHHHSPRHADRKFGVSSTLWDHVFRTY